MRLLLANDFLGPKRFGRMFPQAARFRPPAELLIKLGAALADPDTEDPKADSQRDSRIPAGFTYFGQFVDHDITFDPTIGLPPVEDPENLESRRTPRLDLDSVYGMGPVASPELYVDPVDPNSTRFKIGRTVTRFKNVLGKVTASLGDWCDQWGDCAACDLRRLRAIPRI